VFGAAGHATFVPCPPLFRSGGSVPAPGVVGRWPGPRANTAAVTTAALTTPATATGHHGPRAGAGGGTGWAHEAMAAASARAASADRKSTRLNASHQINSYAV